MREFSILLGSKELKAVKARFVGLHKNEDVIEEQQGDSVDDIGKIDALEEELDQSDRYLHEETK